MFNFSSSARHAALEQVLGELVCQRRISHAKCKKPIHADWCVRDDETSVTRLHVTGWERLGKEVCLGEYDEEGCKVMGGTSSAASACQPQPDACDERRDAVDRITVMRKQVANTTHDVHQAAVNARENKHAAVARAVVGRRNLRQQRH